MKVGETIEGVYVNFPESEFEGTGLTNRGPSCGLCSYTQQRFVLQVLGSSRWVVMRRAIALTTRTLFVPILCRLASNSGLRQVPFGTLSCSIIKSTDFAKMRRKNSMGPNKRIFCSPLRTRANDRAIRQSRFYMYVLGSSSQLWRRWRKARLPRRSERSIGALRAGYRKPRLGSGCSCNAGSNRLTLLL